MVIAVVSDTHRFSSYINKVREMTKNVDIVIHLGDNVDDAELIAKNFNGKVYIVKGNCDYSVRYPKEDILEVEGSKIFICHGHEYNVKYTFSNIFYKGKEVEADIVLFGHTHKGIILEEEGMLIMNPGSVSLPRASRRTIGFLELERGKKVNAYLKEIK